MILKKNNGKKNKTKQETNFYRKNFFSLVTNN